MVQRVFHPYVSYLQPSSPTSGSPASGTPVAPDGDVPPRAPTEAHEESDCGALLASSDLVASPPVSG